jgi:hypothetical protein
MKDKIKFTGTVTLWLEDESKEFKEEINKVTHENLIVYTGINFIYDLLSNQIEDYYDPWTGSPNLYLHYIALGTSPSTNDLSEVGVQLTDWRLTMEGNGEHTLRTTINEYTQENHDLTLNARFPSHLFPYHPYDVWEMGTFLDEIPPLENPEIDETQKPHTMFNRIVFPNRYQVPDRFTLKAEWKLSLSSTLPASQYAYLFYDDFDNYAVGQFPYLWEKLTDSIIDGIYFTTSAAEYADPPNSGMIEGDVGADAGFDGYKASFEAQQSGIISVGFKYYADSANNAHILMLGIVSDDFSVAASPSNGIMFRALESDDTFAVQNPDGSFTTVYDFSGSEDRWYNIHYTVNITERTYHLTIVDAMTTITVYSGDHDFTYWSEASYGVGAIGFICVPRHGEDIHLDGFVVSTAA